MPNDVLRHRLTSGAIAAGFIVAAYSQVRVQVFDRDRLMDEAGKRAHFELEKTEPARRGTVYSSDGKVLAQSEDAYELSLNSARVPRSPAFFVALSEATGIPSTELAVGPTTKKSRYWRTALTPEQTARVRQAKSEWDADGVSLERSHQRDYPLAEVGAGIVGVFREGKPVSGVELSQNAVLEGSAGTYKGFVDRTGSFVPDPDAQQRERRNGSEVVLTIDSGLQAAATQAVRAAVESNKAKSGCAVVVEPSTGDLLAVANWPTFDPNESWKPGDDYNMATMGAYEPGSTFKILTLARGLDTGAVKPTDHTRCNGQMTVGKRVIHCADHEGGRAHGDVDLERAIGKSCNVSAANWALKVGYNSMVSFMDRLGLFEKTELGLPFEKAGRFNRKDPSRQLQLATVGFGQSMGCVPVQLAAAYAMLANGGRMMEPRLFRQIGDQAVPVRERGQIVKPETASEVMRLMESVIESSFGTGKALRIPGYRLAGKTGTAQKVGTSAGKYVANFVGMVPADHPRAVVLVMIDSPSAGQYYGGTVAGPVFVNIAKSVIRRFGIPPSTPSQR